MVLFYRGGDLQKTNLPNLIQHGKVHIFAFGLLLNNEDDKGADI